MYTMNVLVLLLKVVYLWTDKCIFSENNVACAIQPSSFWHLWDMLALSQHFQSIWPSIYAGNQLRRGLCKGYPN